MSYNPNQQYNPNVRRDAAGGSYPPQQQYQNQPSFQGQNPYAGGHQPQQQPAFRADDGRSLQQAPVQQQGNFGRAPASEYDARDAYQRQDPAPYQNNAGYASYAGAAPFGGRGQQPVTQQPVSQQPYNPAAAQQYRPQTHAPIQNAAPYQQQVPSYRGDANGADGAYNRPDDRYYPGGGGNESAQGNSLSSLKQTLAQTISNLAAASASGNAALGSAPHLGSAHGPSGGYVNSTAPDYGAYNPQAGRPAGANQGYNAFSAAAPGVGAPYNDPRSVVRDVRDVRDVRNDMRDNSGGAPYHAQTSLAAINQARVGTTHARYVPDSAPVQQRGGAHGGYDARSADTGYAPVHQQAPDRGYQAGPATGGGAALGQNPPNTTGFYNRRPAQDSISQGGMPGAQGGPVLRTPAHVAAAISASGHAQKRDFAAMYDPSPGLYNAAPAAHAAPHSHVSAPPHAYQQPAPSGSAGGAGRAAYQPDPIAAQRQQYQQTGVPSFSPTHSPAQTGWNAPYTAQSPQHVSQGYPQSASYPGAGASATQQYPPAGGNQFAPAAQPFPTRISKWSARLMDPLDFTDGLLQNSIRHIVSDVTSASSVFPVPDGSITKSTPSGRRVTVTSSGGDRDRDSSATGRASGDLSRYGPGVGTTSAAADASKRPRRDRSASPVRSRSRSSSVTPAAVADRSDRSARASDATASSAGRTANARGAKGANSGPIPSARPSSGLPFGARSARPVSYATAPVANLAADFHLPVVRADVSTQLRAIDLYSKFPKLYLPNDFVSVKIDQDAFCAALNGDTLSNVVNSVPIVLESNNPTLLPADDPRRVSSAPSDILDPPRFTYTHCRTINNRVVHDTGGCERVGQFASTVKPVKFQVRVLISCGLRDPEGERVDRLLAQKLRVLCGMRKGNFLLLGCPWSQELDGEGLPEHCTPVTNRSCLARTAQRALLSQALLKVPVHCELDAAGQLRYGCEGLVRLCEIHYHRPQEEIKGRAYPEQEEITTIYMYTLQPSLLAQLTSEDLDAQYEVFSRRVLGTDAGPLVNRAVADWERDFADSLAAAAEAASAMEGRGEERVEVMHGAEEGAGQGTTEESRMAVGNAADAAVKSECTTDAVADGAPVTTDGNGMDVAPGKSDTCSRMQDQLTDIASLLAVVSGVPVSETVAEISPAAPTTAASDAAVTPGPVTVDLTVPHVIVLDGAASSATSTGTGSGAPAVAQDKPREVPAKPTEPSLVLCPMPLPAGSARDATKKQDGLALRMVPLNLLLSYTQEDRSERLFETSVAAELLQSMLSVNYANIVTDFILAEHPTLHGLCDLRVVDATHKLRAMIAAQRSKSSANGGSTRASAKKAATTSSRPPEVVVLDDSDAVAVGSHQARTAPSETPAAAIANNTSTAEGTGAEVEAEHTEPATEAGAAYVPADAPAGAGSDDAAAVKEDALEVEFQVDYSPSSPDANLAADPEDGQDDAVLPETGDAARITAAEGKESEQAQDGERMDVQGGKQEHGDESEDEDDQEEDQDASLMMTETDARIWRRRFVSAARWFDTTDELCLHYEHLQMILYASTRNLSRADVEDALERVCTTKDLLRYETFV